MQTMAQNDPSLVIGKEALPAECWLAKPAAGWEDALPRAHEWCFRRYGWSGKGWQLVVRGDALCARFAETEAAEAFRAAWPGLSAPGE